MVQHENGVTRKGNGLCSQHIFNEKETVNLNEVDE